MAKQERIEKTDKIAQAMCGFCDENKHCVLRDNTPCSEVKCQDCGYKESAEMLICAGYRDSSEYIAEIEYRKKQYDNQVSENTRLRIEIDKLKEQVKQAKIDVLNELKTYSYYDKDYMDSYVIVSDIDKLIEEVQNEQKD